MLLTLLSAVVALLLPTVPASAGTLPAAETRVGSFNPAASDVVGVHECISAGQRAVRGPSQLQVVVGNCVAAEAESGLASAARTCSVNSFTAGTLVLLADGRQIPISKVKPGMKVVATDPATSTTAARRVDAVIVHGGKHTMVDLTFADGSKITATDRHPFWDATTGQFTYAIDLRAGEKVREADGTLLTITETRSYTADLTAYNLAIDDIHTYYAGATPVLVHNTCGNPEELISGGSNARDGVALSKFGKVNSEEQQLVNEAGARTGCSTCTASEPGTTTGNWVVDHQPPTRVVSPGTPQTGFPQCISCMRQQGGVVNAFLRGWLSW